MLLALFFGATIALWFGITSISQVNYPTAKAIGLFLASSLHN
ncbi:hypothetical protein [Helicobacter pylori]